MKEVNRKRFTKRLKITAISILSFLILSVILTIGVGNYFINYALSPSGDGGNRNVNNNTVQAETDSIKALIDKNSDEADKLTEEWKQTVTPHPVNITADDGITLRGNIYYTVNTSHKWVIVVHGYRSIPEDVLAVGREFFLRGYNVLSISLRAHADSEGEYIGMGWLDRLDLLKWIDLVIKEDPDSEIVLHGTSMGAATVMMVSGENLPGNVKAIVEDCGYTSVWDIFSSELKLRFGLPQFPIMYMVDIVAKYKAGYEFKEASALKQVSKSKTPILFIHGDKDDFVPVDMVYKLYNAASGDKDILVIKGASHAESRFAEPEVYYNKVFSFVDKYIN